MTTIVHNEFIYLKNQNEKLKLKTFKIKELKEILRIHKKKFVKEKIKKCYYFKKQEIIDLLNDMFAVLRIQKFLRKKWADNGNNEPICPLSLEPVKYPLFAFKPKGTRKFIYYNLEILSTFLLNSGDFKDPSTRETYSEEILKSIDNELQKNNIVIKNNLKSIYKASINKKYYKKKKEIEDSILVIDRCLDEIISSLRYWVENKKTNIEINILYIAFKSYFKRLCSFSTENAQSLIKRTISSINNSTKDEDVVSSNYRDNIIQFLYQLQYDELGL